MSDYMVEHTSGARAIRYSNMAVAIHWLSAALIIVQIIIGLTFVDMPRGPERTGLLTWHTTVGVIILLLALARLAVRLMYAPPPYPESFPKWERRVAVWSHRSLYFLIIALPLTGLAAVSKGAVGGLTGLVGGMRFPVVPIPVLGETHALLAWSMIVLLAIHVLGALKNQFVTGGPVAGRMPPFRATTRTRFASVAAPASLQRQPPVRRR